MTDKTKSKIKGITAAAVAVVLAGGVAASLAVGIKNNGWFGESETAQIETSETADNGGATISDVAENGIKLMAVPMSSTTLSDTAESEYTVTATIANADTAFDLGITLSVDFADASSDWASGKTASDYVSLSTTHIESGESFTVSCNEAFGEQILVTATADGSPTGNPQTASVTVDYCKRVTGASLRYLNYSTYEAMLEHDYYEWKDDGVTLVTKNVGTGLTPSSYLFYLDDDEGESDTRRISGTWGSGSTVNTKYGSVSYNSSTGLLTFNGTDYFENYYDEYICEFVYVYVTFYKQIVLTSSSSSSTTLTDLDDTCLTSISCTLEYGTGTYVEDQTITVTLPNGGTSYTLTKNSDSSYSYSGDITWEELCTSSFGYTSGSEKALYNTLKTAYDSSSAWTFGIETCGAITGESKSFTDTGLIIDPSGLYVYVSGVSVNTSNVKF